MSSIETKLMDAEKRAVIPIGSRVEGEVETTFHLGACAVRLVPFVREARCQKVTQLLEHARAESVFVRGLKPAGRPSPQPVDNL